MRGGLGNQMFQYALGLALREKGFKVKYDISLYSYESMHNGFELERVFGVEEKMIITVSSSQEQRDKALKLYLQEAHEISEGLHS